MAITVDLSAVPAQPAKAEPILPDERICGISRDFLGCAGCFGSFVLGFLVALPVGLAPTSEGEEQRKVAAAVIGSVAIALFFCSLGIVAKENETNQIEYDARPGDPDYNGQFG